MVDDIRRYRTELVLDAPLPGLWTVTPHLGSEGRAETSEAFMLRRGQLDDEH
jgi:hypothetical protein